MTPTEILSEIQKMPLVEKHKVFLELTEQLNQAEQTELKAEEKKVYQWLKTKRAGDRGTTSFAGR